MHTLVGLGMSYVAGFYCLRISRGTNLRYPLILGAIVLALTIAAGAAWNLMDLSTLLGLGVLTVAVTLLGGVMALRPRR
jgi:hypothetical protein